MVYPFPGYDYAGNQQKRLLRVASPECDLEYGVYPVLYPSASIYHRLSTDRGFVYGYPKSFMPPTLAQQGRIDELEARVEELETAVEDLQGG